MISYSDTDVLNERDIANTVNLTGALGSGLANRVAKAWPGCVDPYRQALEDGTLKEGTVVSWLKPDGGFIFQVPTKRDWRDPSPLELIEASIKALIAHCRTLGTTELHAVRLGCGPGGLDWKSQVEPILRRCLGNYPALHVVVHD